MSPYAHTDAARYDQWRRMLWHAPVAEFAKLPATLPNHPDGCCRVCGTALPEKEGRGRPPKYCGACRDTWPAVQHQRASRVLGRAA